jgi:DNA-binding NtrC family response regulator
MKNKILVVDDSATLRASVNYTLKGSRFETINAVNVPTAWKSSTRP